MDKNCVKEGACGTAVSDWQAGYLKCYSKLQDFLLVIMWRNIASNRVISATAQEILRAPLRNHGDQ